MSVLNFPTLTRSAATITRFSLIANTQTFTSPLNKSVQTSELPGARWKASVTWSNLVEADARAMKAFLARLRGMAGRFYLYDHSHPMPSGTAAGTPLVKGASQTGNTLNTDGWTANQSGLLLPGDYLGVNGQMVMVTEPASADSGGNATITFEAPLRSSPADNLGIVTYQPTCTMMLIDDEQDQIEFDPERRPSVSIQCVEAF